MKHPQLVLQISATGGWNWAGSAKGANWTKVTFTGPNADEMAADYVSRKGHLAMLYGENDGNDWVFFPKTMAVLEPTCEHGLSANLCYGPQHYPYDDQL